MRRITIERRVHFCVREREIGREGLASRASSPMLALHILAHTAFGIRGKEGCAIVLDLVRGWVLLLHV